MSAFSLYTIPAGSSFLGVIAESLREEYNKDPLELARITLLLPTRRACRSMREAFLKTGGNEPLLLPRLHPIGDVDEEELSLSIGGIDQEFSLPPAIRPMQRQLLLARLIEKTGRGRGLAQDLALADALSRLMDQVYNEKLDLAALPDVVDNADFSKHWQISIDFLSVLSEHWPLVLAERGLMDAADRRNRLLAALGDYWQANPPRHRIIAAGSTGSIPAVRALLKIVAALPNGCVVLPGLDQTMDKASWDNLSDTHPQKSMKNLLVDFETSREDVPLWPARPPKDDDAQTQRRLTARLFCSEIMRPAETSDGWQDLSREKNLDLPALSIERYDCASPQEESLVIALALRRALEDPNETAALVTPDRRLARRVAMACRRWGIAIDDSAGEPLSHTRAGLFARLALCVLSEDFRPVPLLSFCKHVLCNPPGSVQWRAAIRALDRHLLRGPCFNSGLAALTDKIKTLEKDPRVDQDIVPGLYQTVRLIDSHFAPLADVLKKGKALVSEWCEAHLKTLEHFCPPGILWAAQDGEAAALLFTALQEDGEALGLISFLDYSVLLDNAMSKITVRPVYGQHPRLSILGQLESRLIDHDTIILSGLNEGTWPASPPADPWMSRPMRRKFGLPSPEYEIGLAAHDFVQNVCAKKVVLTRAARVDGTPTVPSRWLQRMETVQKACGYDDLYGDGILLSYARTMDKTSAVTPIGRPAPRPPVPARPRRLSVTKIDTWMKDPYSIYAGFILKLEKLKPLDQPLDAAMRGTLIHKIMERFTASYPSGIPKNHDSAVSAFMEIARSELDAAAAAKDVRYFWEARLLKIAAWVVARESVQRKSFRPVSETKGMMVFNRPGGDFMLRAVADRIDISHDGKTAAIIDYKSGGNFTKVGLESGRYPQLPLEGLILESGGFENLGTMSVETLAYWIVNGGGEGGEAVSLDDGKKVAQALENARSGLQDLIDTFDKIETPYYSVPHAAYTPDYNDYEHLARIQEWSAFSGQEGDES